MGVLDPSRQNPVTLEICGRSFTLQLTEKLSEQRIKYACPTPPRTIRFTNLKPLSPRAVGLSADDRPLALALESVEIAADR
jgi:hypothetical protein